METFLPALAGGFLIGGAAVALLYFLGRLAGVSGIIWGAISGQPDSVWRWCFIAGLMGGSLLFHQVAQQAYPVPSPLPWWQALAGGVLVGFGVKLGNGCTSGHGVCGIGRLSPRSFVATCVFMLTGIVTVLIVRHVLGAS